MDSELAVTMTPSSTFCRNELTPVILFCFVVKDISHFGLPTDFVPKQGRPNIVLRFLDIFSSAVGSMYSVRDIYPTQT
jgi:hypothetical protein